MLNLLKIILKVTVFSTIVLVLGQFITIRERSLSTWVAAGVTEFAKSDALKATRTWLTTVSRDAQKSATRLMSSDLKRADEKYGDTEDLEQDREELKKVLGH